VGTRLALCVLAIALLVGAVGHPTGSVKSALSESARLAFVLPQASRNVARSRPGASIDTARPAAILCHRIQRTRRLVHGVNVWAKLRDDTLDALAIDLLTQVLEEDKPAEGLIKKAFQRLGTRATNEQRKRLSRRVLGVSVLRVKLAFIVDWVDAEQLINTSEPCAPSQA
jgi:hypothetical protein